MSDVILFFDTETSSLVDHKRSAGLHQPHAVQLAAILQSNDSTRELSSIIRPNGWTISPKAEEVHGISLERAQREGTPIEDVLQEFIWMLSMANIVVAHNITFDHKVVASEFIRLGLKEDLFAGKRFFCTMMESKGVLKIPGYYGDYKWPSLAEAYRALVGGEIEGAHDAMCDVQACRAIYWALQKRLRSPAEIVTDQLVDVFQQPSTE